MTGVKIVRVIDASVETVFEAVTTAEGIAQWWGPDDGPVLSSQFDATVGGRFRVRFRMLDGTEHECDGEVLDIERPTRVVTSWRWHGKEADGQSRVTISLRPIGKRCELVFSHDLLPDDEATVKGHEEGWKGSLEKLQRHLSSKQDAPSTQEST